jgi:hypothetical protein
MKGRYTARERHASPGGRITVIPAFRFAKLVKGGFA